MTPEFIAELVKSSTPAQVMTILGVILFIGVIGVLKKANFSSFLLKSIELRSMVEKKPAYCLNKEYTVACINCKSCMIPRLEATSPFFSDLNNEINYNLSTCKFGDPGRSAVFRDLLRIKLTCFMDAFSKVLKNPIKEDSAALFVAVTAAFDESMEYVEKCLAYGIPKVVVDSFQTLHIPRVKESQSRIHDFCFDEDLEFNYYKLHAILLHLSGALNDTVRDGERSISLLNGSLTGVSYREFTIGPPDKHNEKH